MDHYRVSRTSSKRTHQGVAQQHICNEIATLRCSSEAENTIWETFGLSYVLSTYHGACGLTTVHASVVMALMLLAFMMEHPTILLWCVSVRRCCVEARRLSRHYGRICKG